MIEITNEDNMKLMARYEDNYFDLAIVTPPYGIDINRVKRHQKAEKEQSKSKAGRGWKEYKTTEWDNEIPKDEYFKEYLGFLKSK